MATRSAKIDQKADLIWAIADKLTGVYKPHEYGDVILPLTVIRRFDCILSDTKDAVLQKYDEVKNLPMKDILLRKASKKDFYNTSKYTFERLMDDPDHIHKCSFLHTSTSGGHAERCFRCKWDKLYKTFLYLRIIFLLSNL